VYNDPFMCVGVSHANCAATSCIQAMEARDARGMNLYFGGAAILSIPLAMGSEAMDDI